MEKDEALYTVGAENAGVYMNGTESNDRTGKRMNPNRGRSTNRHEQSMEQKRR